MASKSREYRNRITLIRVPSVGKEQIKSKKNEMAHEENEITQKDLEQFEMFYDIDNAEPLTLLNKDKKCRLLHKFGYLSDQNMYNNSINDGLSEGCISIDSFMDVKSEHSINNLSRPIKNVSNKISRPITKLIDNDEPHMDWKHYHRLDVIYKFMEDLEEEFPSLCTTGVIGKSLEGRDIKILKISNSNAANSCVWIDAGIHAREWIAPAVNTFLANHIAKNFDALSDSMRNKDWYFLPVVNPDGYEYTHTENRMWRKNKASLKSDLFGVDLNRNFSYGWGGKGSSDDPNHAFYRGPRPFSEPESAAMRNVFMNSGVTFKVYITLHSFGEVIIMPYAYSEQLASDYIKLLQGATIMSRAIYDTFGNTYKVGVSKDVMYRASGTSNDWSHGAVGIPFCYLIELRSKKHKFKLPEIEIAETGTEILNCMIALMDFIDKYEATDVIKDPNAIAQFCSRTHIFNNIKMNDDEMKDTNSSPSNESQQPNVKFSIPFLNKDRIEGWNRLPLVYPHWLWDVSHESLDCYKLFLQLFIYSVKVAPLSPNTQVWQVTFTNENDRTYLRALDTFGVINIWFEDNLVMDIMVEGPKAAIVATMLHGRDIQYSIAMPKVNLLYEREQRPLLMFCGRGLGCKPVMDWKRYHRLDTIYKFMDELVAEYPYLCSVVDIGETAEGRNIKMLVISDGEEGNQGVWIDGTIHAREWISPAVVTYIADKIVRNFHIYPDSVTKKDWYIIPVLNPDGYEYTHTTDRMWRKNRAKHGDSYGVDLNRNFSTGWGAREEDSSSSDPGNIFYRGPSPFSERETNAVKNTILESQTQFKVFISMHSYGEAILFPWGYSWDPCPDYVSLLEGGTVMARAVQQSTGRIYKVGSTRDIMYFAEGTSIDWSYECANIMYSYMLELRGKEHKFLLPKEQIIITAKEVLSAVLALLTFIDGKPSVS